MLRPLYLRGNNLQYPLDWQLSAVRLEAVAKKKIPCLWRESNRRRPSHSQSLYWKKLQLMYRLFMSKMEIKEMATKRNVLDLTQVTHEPLWLNMLRWCDWKL
jgi:hypothetical protein